MRLRLLVALSCVSATASAQLPPSDESADALGPPDTPQEVREEAEAEVAPAPSDCAAVLAFAGQSYQACGTNVVVLQGEQVVRVYDLDVTPSDLFERNGRVWFELDGHAHALDGYEPRATVATPVSDATVSIAPVPEPALAPPEPPPFDGPSDLDPNSSYGARISPERMPGFQVGLSVMPVLGDGFALMGDAFVAYRARRPFSVRLVIDRLGYAFSTNDGDSFGVADGALLLGYDHRIFEMSVGVGTTRARIDDFDRRLDGMAPTIMMGMRFGALDGLHVSVSTSLLFASGETTLSTIAVRMQWPLSVGRWLVIRGSGGGPASYGWGEIGIRILTRGQRGRGSLFVTPAIGGAGLFDNLSFQRASGFAMSLSVEYRP